MNGSIRLYHGSVLVFVVGPNKKDEIVRNFDLEF